MHFCGDSRPLILMQLSWPECKRWQKDRYLPPKQAAPDKNNILCVIMKQVARHQPEKCIGPLHTKKITTNKYEIVLYRYYV
jgi:hypothetical protein